MHSSANKKLTKSLHNLFQAIRSHVVTRKIIIARGPLLLTDPHFLNLGLLGLEFCNFRRVSQSEQKWNKRTLRIRLILVCATGATLSSVGIAYWTYPL